MFDRLMSLLRPKPADPYEQFVGAFLEECKRQGRKPTSYDHQTRSFVIGDREGFNHTVFLENSFRSWCRGSPKARAEQLSRFVRSLGEGEIAIDPATLAAELMPGIRSRALPSDGLVQGWILGIPEGNDNETAWTPFCGELVACVVRDHQDSMTLVTRSDLDSAKLSFDQAMAQAMAQFRAKAPHFVPHPRAPDLYCCNNLEDYQSSLLLMTPGTDFKFPALDGDAVALVPSRNWFFVTGSRNRPALKALLDLAETAGQQPHFCSSALLVWRDGRWVEYAFEAGTNEAARQRRIAIMQLASDYDRQKEQLDRLHSSQDKDIYVAKFMVYQKKDQQGSEFFSVAALASGNDGTLLPVSDRLTFVVVDQIINPQTGRAEEGARDIVSVSWSDAMAIAGHLLQPVPNLYPPRYRSLGFPDADMWGRLRAKAVN